MKTRTIALFAVALFVYATSMLQLGGCSAGGSGGAQEKPQWAYAGEYGPENWSKISPECAVCSQGLEQSPVDIPTGPGGANVNAADIVFSYEPSELDIINNGHTIQVNYDEGSFIEVEGERYNLLQFHFHALSEHTVSGEHFDMEVHLVHQSAEGVYAVVGVFMTRGAHNAAYQPVRKHAPAGKGEARTITGVQVSAIDLLPQDRSYYRYDGSFTTPPCTEGVKWFVMATPVELSSAQMSAFESIYNNNYRPVQPLNSRSFY